MLIHSKWGDQLQRKFADAPCHCLGFVLSTDEGRSVWVPTREDTFHTIAAAIGNEEAPAQSLRNGKGMPN